eukprot:scpid80500/ scgid23739/ Probable polyprenol reductase 2
MLVDAFWATFLVAFTIFLVCRGIWIKTPTLLMFAAAYGKHLPDRIIDVIPIFFVPKSWFKVFYVIGSLWSAALFYSCLSVCLGSDETSNSKILALGKWLIRFPELTHDAEPATATMTSVSSSDALVCVGLMFLQTSRRLYEELFVMHPSPRAKMQTYVFVYGAVFYVFAQLVMIEGSPFALDAPVSCPSVPTLSLVRYVIATVLFAWASYHQHMCHRILGSLRKPGDTKYYVPHGDWFDYSSSAHYTAELVIYLAFGMLVGAHPSWWLVFGVAFTSLTYVSLNTHQYYKDKFDNYPASRAAIFPFVL